MVGGERLPSYNVIWAAGGRGVGCAGSRCGTGYSGRTCKGAAGLLDLGTRTFFAIEDVAHLVDSQIGRRVPAVSQDALPMGRCVANVIQEDLNGRRRARDAGFDYKDLGSMATIG